MKKQFLYITIFSIFGFLCSCQIQKKATSSKIYYEENQQRNALAIKQHDIKTAQFNNVNIKINASGKAISARASIKIITDSIMQISLQPLGVEMARLNITPEEFILVNKFQKRYIEGSIKNLQEMTKTNICFSNLQALFLNQFFVAGENLKTISEILSQFTATPYPEGYTLKGTRNKDGLLTSITVDKDSKITHTEVSYGTSMNMLICSYSNFQKIDKIEFPLTYKIQILEGRNNNGCELSIQDVKFNKDVIVNDINKSKYTKVTDFEQLIK